MFTRRRVSSAMVLVAMAAAVCSAQSITSAHSGTVHYFEGAVSIDGTQVESKVGRFSEIKEQGVLRTEKGRAEVLLTPGVFLRVGEDSAIKLLDNRLASTRVEILSGNVIVESDDPQMDVKDSPVSLVWKDYDISIVRHGLVEISTDSNTLKVYKGIARVSAGSEQVMVKEGHLLPFSAALTTEKFNDRLGDELYLWARDRSQNLSAASMSSARSLQGNGFSSSGIGNWGGGWYYNPYFSMFTFVPAAGTLWNPWGFGFYSPGTIYNYYAPTTYYWYGAGGAPAANSVGRTISGFANPTTTKAAPIGRLQATTAGSLPALNSPIRGGNTIGAIPDASNGGFAGGPAASSIGAGRTAGMSSGGGGFGAVAAAPAAAPAGGGAAVGAHSSGGARGR